MENCGFLGPNLSEYHYTCIGYLFVFFFWDNFYDYLEEGHQQFNAVLYTNKPKASTSHCVRWLLQIQLCINCSFVQQFRASEDFNSKYLKRRQLRKILIIEVVNITTKCPTSFCNIKRINLHFFYFFFFNTVSRMLILMNCQIICDYSFCILTLTRIQRSARGSLQL